MTTRRNFLKHTLMGGVALSSRGIPQAIARARAIAPAPNTAWHDAEHVVILMQENRSFDHVFGMLSGVRGFNDPHPLRLSTGQSAFYQPNKDGTFCAPWRLNIHDTKVTWMGSIPHSRDSQVDAWNEGRYDGWLEAKRSYHKEWRDIPMTMGYYTREDLPFYYAMADAFTVCDQHYCGIMSSTTPNRLMFWTGTVRDRQDEHSRVYMRNAEILETRTLNWTTFPERLEKVGVSWGFYQNEITAAAGMSEEEEAWLSNFGCNVLEFFEAYHVSSRPDFGQWIQERIDECHHHIRRLEKQEDLASGKAAAQLLETRAFLAWLESRRDTGRPFETLTPEERSLFSRAFITNKADKNYRKLEDIQTEGGADKGFMKAPRGDVLYQFRQDVKNGTLPTVSWLAAPEHFSDHPTSAWYGTWYVSELLNILTEDPEMWRKTIFILTYDENDGYFDHCCSYAAPDPKRPETGLSSSKIGPDGLEYTTKEDEYAQGVPAHLARSGSIGLGFRVPMIVASPWSRGGWVNSELCDHSSSLQFLEAFVEKKYSRSIRETNISPWRRAICGNLTSCFHTEEEQSLSMPFMDRDQHLKAIESARHRPVPGGYHLMSEAALSAALSSRHHDTLLPQQEAGARPSCALPYEMFCDGGVGRDGSHFALLLKADNALYGAAARGVPFNVHTYRHGEMVQAGTYAVAAGDQLALPLPLPEGDERYDIAVHAPNGFYRLYQGTRSLTTIQTLCRYEVREGRGKANSTLMIELHNEGTERCRLQAMLNGKDGVKRQVSVPAQSHVTLPFDVTSRHGWYDITLTMHDDETFCQMLAGRIETGRPSVTDPMIGHT